MAKGNWHTEAKAENKLKLEEKKNRKIGTYMVPGVSKFTYVFFFHHKAYFSVRELRLSEFK